MPVVECVYIYGDNKSVLVNLLNLGTPHSQMQKKSNSVVFHHVREGFAVDEWRTTYINTHENIADLIIKNLPSGIKRTKFCKMLLHFLMPSIEVGKEADHHAAATTVKVLPGLWIGGIVGAVEVSETEQTAAQA